MSRPPAAVSPFLGRLGLSSSVVAHFFTWQERWPKGEEILMILSSEAGAVFVGKARAPEVETEFRLGERPPHDWMRRGAHGEQPRSRQAESDRSFPIRYVVGDEPEHRHALVGHR